MERDWDLLRKQLGAIEQEYHVLADVLDKTKWLNEAEREKEETRQLGHIELLIDNGLVEGIHLGRDINGHYIFSNVNPRLTMAGHDLLDTLRSPKLWEQIKSSARKNGIELTISAIKYLAVEALQRITSIV
jgi:hypothetical protein